MARVALIGADFDILTFYMLVVMVAGMVWRLPNSHTCAWHVAVSTVSSGGRGQTPNSLVYIDVDI